MPEWQEVLKQDEAKLQCKAPYHHSEAHHKLLGATLGRVQLKGGSFGAVHGVIIRSSRTRKRWIVAEGLREISHGLKIVWMAAAKRTLCSSVRGGRPSRGTERLVGVGLRMQVCQSLVNLLLTWDVLNDWLRQLNVWATLERGAPANRKTPQRWIDMLQIVDLRAVRVRLMPRAFLQKSRQSLMTRSNWSVKSRSSAQLLRLTPQVLWRPLIPTHVA